MKQLIPFSETIERIHAAVESMGLQDADGLVRWPGCIPCMYGALRPEQREAWDRAEECLYSALVFGDDLEAPVAEYELVILAAIRCAGVKLRMRGISRSIERAAWLAREEN